MRPCELKREDCLLGQDLEQRLRLRLSDLPPTTPSSSPAGSSTSSSAEDMATAMVELSPFWSETAATITTTADDETVEGTDGDALSASSSSPAYAQSAPTQSTRQERLLSTFERVLSAHPPILESLLAQLPTTSVLDLFHTSCFLRNFLQSYPLAWRALSFRLPQPTLLLGSPGMETPDSRERQSKQYSLDALLIQIIMPLATRLKSLDVCNTAISGVALVSKVMQPKIATLEHLSVRGCKNVSIKYHIVPFLQLHSPRTHPLVEKMALKSLYTYRCRHHRRRPYLPSSLVRRDSDSEPTHELIEICHQLGIWTDTAWCPTPGGRCFRRKDYHGNRAAPGTQEVWVPFDRLWRSGNRIGPTEEQQAQKSDGRLWEDMESGHDGEALGTETFTGEGKYLAAHLRKSHRTFVDEVKCDQCSELILERCETCSIKMHCMGCRKTLCASCSFNRPIPRKRTKIRHFPSLLGTNHSHLLHAFAAPQPTAPTLAPTQLRHSDPSRRKNKFWWAPGAIRSPNLMSELPPDSDSDDLDDPSSGSNSGHLPVAPAAPLKLNMHWCCLEPIFSGGGGVAFLGPGLGGSGSDRIRAVPLPKRKDYEDPDFQHTLVNPESIEKLKNVRLYEEIMGENVDVLPYLMQDSLDLQATTCPRSLCQDCYRSFRWKVACRGCKRALCKEHDFRGLKVRKCGFRELGTEREYIRNPPPPSLQQSVGRGKWDLMSIPAFRRAKGARAEFGSGASTPVPLHEDDDQGTVPMARIASTASSSADSSQLLAPAPTPTGAESIHDFDMTSSLADLSPRSGPGPSSSRQRSVSLSGLQDHSASTAGFITPAARAEAQKRYLLPPNGNHPVQWQGCGAYFCQQIRPAGDCRARCSVQLKECTDCAVLVCEFCLQNTPPCPCRFCSDNYHCPVCAIKPQIKAQCTREQELRDFEEARVKEMERAKMEKVQMKWADDVAEAVGEFYLGVE